MPSMYWMPARRQEEKHTAVSPSWLPTSGCVQTIRLFGVGLFRKVERQRNTRFVPVCLPLAFPRTCSCASYLGRQESLGVNFFFLRL